MKITRNQLKELVKRAIYSKISEQETVKFKDPETDKDHEITMDTARQYKSDIDKGDKSKEKAAAVKAAGLDKDDKGAEEKPEPKQTKISADPFSKGKDDDSAKTSDSGDATKSQDLAYDVEQAEDVLKGEFPDTSWLEDFSDALEKETKATNGANGVSSSALKAIEKSIADYDDAMMAGDDELAKSEMGTIRDIYKQRKSIEFRDSSGGASSGEEPIPSDIDSPPEDMSEEEWNANGLMSYITNANQGHKDFPEEAQQQLEDLENELQDTYPDFNPEDVKDIEKRAMKVVQGYSKGGEFTPEGMSAIKWENRKKKLGKFVQGLKDAPRKSVKSAVYMLYGGPFWDQILDPGGEGFGTDTYFKDAFKKDESVIKTEKQLREVIRKTMHKLISEDKKYKAKKKDGKVVYFTNKDNWKKALKTGDYEKVDSKKVDSKKVKDKKQMFNVFVDGEDEPMKIKAKDAKSARNQAYQKIQNPNVKVTAEPAGVGGPSHADVPKKGKKPSEQEKKAKLNKDIDDFIDNSWEDYNENEIDSIIKTLKSRNVDTYELETIKNDIKYDLEDDNWEMVANQVADLKDDLKYYKDETSDEYVPTKKTADTGGGKAELDNAYKQAQKLKKELRALVDKGDIETAKKKEAEIKKFWADTIEPLEKKVKPEASKKWSDMLGQESVREAAGAVARGAARTAGKAAYKGAAMAGVAAKKAAKKMKDKKKEREDESLDKRVTVKEVRTWMKTLEENRYKKIYNSDARRVSWMVNNMGENVENMPVSMRKKWTKAQYGRERYLAKEFIKSKKRQMTENKIRKAIRIILEGKIVRYEIPMKDKKKVQALVKKLRFKDGKDYAIYGSGRTFEMELDAKHADKVLELLMKMNIKVRG